MNVGCDGFVTLRWMNVGCDGSATLWRIIETDDAICFASLKEWNFEVQATVTNKSIFEVDNQ